MGVAENNVYRLMKFIQRVKKSVNVPVTTGEIWNIWRDHPALAASVDFIAAHVLPYWENFASGRRPGGRPSTSLLRDQFPGKRIVIAEFGWPSAGYNLRNADPGPFQQASVLRNFVARAEAIGMDYNIVEAIDQPWKYFEGGVAPIGACLTPAREPKFSWTGPIVNPDYWKLATIALLVGILMSLPILRLAEPTCAGAAAVGGRQRCRRLGRDRVRLLGRPLFRVRLGFRPHPRRDTPCSPCPHRNGADRGDRRGCLRPPAAKADRQGRALAPATLGEN